MKVGGAFSTVKRRQNLSLLSSVALLSTIFIFVLAEAFAIDSMFHDDKLRSREVLHMFYFAFYTKQFRFHVLQENSDFKQFRGPGVRLEKLWGEIFGDSYATGEDCVVPGMDCPPDTTTSTNLEHESNILESQLGTPDPDTPMTECDHSAEKLGRLDPGFFRGSHTSPGEGQTSSTPTSPTLAPMPSAPKRPSPISSGGSRSSPLGSSSDGSKRAKLSHASMFKDVSELQEEGKWTNTLTENLCAAGNFVTKPLTPATHPPPVVDRVPSIQDAYSILCMMSDEGLLERGSDEFCFAADKIVDENNRQGFMFLCSNRDRLGWLKYEMKINK